MEFDEDYAERRRKTFAVKVGPCRDATVRGEMRMEFTHNGFQWSSITLTPEEAEKVVLALAGALKK